MGSVDDTPFRLPQSASLSKLDAIRKYDLSAPTDERQRLLRDLLLSHHFTTAPLREPQLILHDHMPHILGSALDLGVDASSLKETFDTVMKTLIKIDSTFPRGEKIENGHFRDYFRQKEFALLAQAYLNIVFPLTLARYTVAFVDYFDRQFELANGEWKKVTHELLFHQDEPLMNGLVGGLGHPIIHLAYAYELGSKEIASEGLSLACTEYSEFHGLIDHPPPDTGMYKTSSLGEVLEKVRQDNRFDGLLEHPGVGNLRTVMEKHGATVLEHWNAWQVDHDDTLQQLEQICDFATVLAMTTVNEAKEFDFYLIHLMTVAHGLRVLWPFFPAERKAPMLREYAIMTVASYIAQLRPAFHIQDIESVDVRGRDWDWVVKTAKAHPAKFDVHFFKVVRAPRAFAQTYGAKEGFYLKAVIKFLEEFRGWGGFGLGLDGFDPKGEGWNAPVE